MVRGLTYRRCKRLVEKLEDMAETWEDRDNNPDRADSIRYCVGEIRGAMMETFGEQEEEIPEVPPQLRVVNYDVNYGWICPVCGRGNGPSVSTCPCKPIEYVVTC